MCKSLPTIIFLFVNFISIINNQLFSIPSFGSNKPHLLFHLGQRQPIAMNMGWGYWQNQLANPSKLRFNYQNTKNDLYVDVKSHNGNNHIQQQIHDKQLQINSFIKYQNITNGWETQIVMDNYHQSPAAWFVYFSIENNKEELIDYQKYSTPKTFSFIRKDNNHIQIKYKKSIRSIVNGESVYLQQKLTIKSSKKKDQLKIFGLSANISQTYNIRNIAQQFKTIISAHKYPKIPRTNDTNLKKWENQQIKLIKDDDWEDKLYVIGFIYGQFNAGLELYITNTTQEAFNQNKFGTQKTSLSLKYFQEHPKRDILKHVIFNLYAGMAYYQGKLLTQNSLIIHQHDYCYGFTPSRLIFPRSFLWDDGFHLMVVVKHQPTIVLQVLENWFNKIDLFGWIGREQIRGATMISLMPQLSFVFQDSFEMNPPTLFLSIEYIFRNRENKSDGQNNLQTANSLKTLLQKNFNKLQRWYNYFKKTQSHYNLIYEQQLNKTISYRWRCKDQCKNGNFMGSGLDDYPRTNNKRQISKKHVDILCWLIYFANSLTSISKQLNLPQQNYYKKQSQAMIKILHSQYLDPSDNLYKDISVHSQGIQLYYQQVLLFIYALGIYIEQYVNHKGYINLFPFFFGYIPKGSPALKKTIQMMMNQSELLSEDGIRSLSISDELYGTQDNYWRGPVWININYLILRACKLFYWGDPQVQKLYETIKDRVIETVQRNYKQSWYLYENYHKGKGNRGYPFYGWTSLIVNIITQDY